MSEAIIRVVTWMVATSILIASIHTQEQSSNCMDPMRCGHGGEQLPIGSINNNDEWTNNPDLSPSFNGNPINLEWLLNRVMESSAIAPESGIIFEESETRKKPLLSLGEQPIRYNGRRMSRGGQLKMANRFGKRDKLRISNRFGR